MNNTKKTERYMPTGAADAVRDIADLLTERDDLTRRLERVTQALSEVQTELKEGADHNSELLTAVADAERRAVEAERAVGVSVGIEESREGLMRKQNERIQHAELRAALKEVADKRGHGGDCAIYRTQVCTCSLRALASDGKPQPCGKCAELRAALETMRSRYLRLDNGMCDGCHGFIGECDSLCPQEKAERALASDPSTLRQAQGLASASGPDGGAESHLDGTQHVMTSMAPTKVSSADGSAAGDVLRAAETTAAQWEVSQLLIAPLCHKLTKQLEAVRRLRKERGDG